MKRLMCMQTAPRPPGRATRHGRPASSPLPRRHRLWCVVALGLLGGCTLGPDYQRPALDLPAAFSATTASAARAWPAEEWWHGFSAAELDSLIAEARAHNDDLAAAAARIRQADAALRIAGAPLLPSFGLDANTSYTRLSPGGANGGGRASAAAGLDQHSYALTGNFASYEVDLWGRLRASQAAARATALASRFDQGTVALTVITGVANTYFQALTYQDRLRSAEANLRDSEQTLAAIAGRRAAGTASDLDVAQQQTLVATERANVPALRSSYEQAVLALGILVGRPPESIHLQGTTLTALALPPVAPGLPAELLARRPDVAYAEAQMVAAHANVRAARAAFFPTLALTGSGGWQSTALGLLTGPGAAFGTLAAGLTAPIFDNGLRSGQLEQARGQQEELVAAYRKSVLQALTDVETALVALRYAADQEVLERDAVASARRAADISRAQMQAGTIDVTTLLTTETSLYNAEDALAQIRLSRALALISLYKALGGGWVLGAPPGDA